MNIAARTVIALAVAGSFVGVGTWLAGGEQLQAQQDVRWESSLQCKACHEDVYAEWFGSHHQISFTNPEVRALSDDFRKEECKDCHLPRPLAITGFGKRCLPRRTQFDEGVSCITCHLGPDGGLIAAHDRPEVPCAPKRNEAMLQVDTCASCHNQHGTTDQWRDSHYQRQGTTCTSCHMPEIERARKDGSKRMGRKHVFDGCHDEATLKQAGRFEVTRDGDQVVLQLTNVGAGHNYPTEERHRAVDMMYRFVTADGGRGEWQRAWRFRMPYRDEMEPINPGNAPGENTQLPAGETKKIEVPIAAGSAAIEARLWYRLTPFVGDDSEQSTLLEERTLELR